MAKKRSIKVYGQSGYKYRETPSIMLKGQWLKDAGFDIGGLYLRNLRRWQAHHCTGR